jgi:hypothetical protein
MNGYFWENDIGKEHIERFNAEVDLESKRLMLAKQAFEKHIAMSPIDQAYEHKEELDDIRETTRLMFIDRAKDCLVDACMRHFSQYLDIEQNTEDTSYPLQQYLKYSEVSEKKAQSGLNFVEAVSFRMVEDVDDNGEPVGDEMLVRFNLPSTFIPAANIGSIEVDNWLAAVDEVIVDFKPSDEKVDKLPEYLISAEVAYPYKPLYEKHMKQLVDKLLKKLLKVDEQEMLKENIKEADSILSILPKLGTMKLYPFKIKDVPIFRG